MKIGTYLDSGISSPGMLFSGGRNGCDVSLELTTVELTHIMFNKTGCLKPIDYSN